MAKIKIYILLLFLSWIEINCGSDCRGESGSGSITCSDMSTEGLKYKLGYAFIYVSLNEIMMKKKYFFSIDNCSNRLNSENLYHFQLKPEFKNKTQTIQLKLRKISFQSNLMTANWFNVNVKLRYLSIESSQILLAKNAFNSWQFAELITLKLVDCLVTHINLGAFIGLNNLQIIRFNDVRMFSIDENVLEPCKNLLSVTVLNCRPRQQITEIDKFFGYAKLPFLERVTVHRCNLHDTINNRTFSGLTGLNYLELSENRINKIGSNSFDTVLETLSSLRLDRNNLRELPENIFKSNRTNLLKINLTNNPWDCNCDMDHLREFVQQEPNIQFISINCSSPKEYEGSVLNEQTSLCRSTFEPTTEHITTVSMDNHFSLICEPNGSFIANLLQPSVDKVISVINDKHLSIAIEHLPKFVYLLEFEETHFERATIKCSPISENLLQMKLIERVLKPNRIHRFCFMRKHFNTILPLDCFTVRSTEKIAEPWLLMEHKTITICILILSFILDPIIGIAISIMWLKVCLIKKQKANAKANIDMFPTAEEEEAVKRLKYGKNFRISFV